MYYEYRLLVSLLLLHSLIIGKTVSSMGLGTRLTEGLGTRISMKRTPLLKCPYDQIFGRPHFYIFVKSMTFLLNFLKSKFEVLTSMESYLFRRFLYKIIRPPLIKHVPEVTSKLKTTWLIILI